MTAPDGWPLWTSPVRPGREHDVTCARAHPDLLPALDTWTDERRVALADLGYEGENNRLVCPVKKPSRPRPGVERRSAHLRQALRHPSTGRTRNSLLKTTFKALRRVSLCPWQIGAITAAALVLLHIEHDRTT